MGRSVHPAHNFRNGSCETSTVKGIAGAQLYGWESSQQASTYTASAERKRLAAEAARLMARDQDANMDCPTELRRRENA
jgi:hypothetical protein